MRSAHYIPNLLSLSAEGGHISVGHCRYDILPRMLFILFPPFNCRKRNSPAFSSHSLVNAAYALLDDDVRATASTINERRQ